MFSHIGSHCDLQRVDAKQLLLGEDGALSLDFEQPVIVTDAAFDGEGCGAVCQNEWTRSSFIKQFGTLPITTGTQTGIALFGPPASADAAKPLTSVVDEIEAAGNNVFAFDDESSVISKIRERTKGWSNGSGVWPQRFAKFSRYQLLSLGGSRAGLPFHDHGPAFLWLVHGRKHWLMFPPGQLPKRVSTLAQGLSTWEWLSNMSTVDLPSTMLQCTQEAGEVMLVPNRWHHATLNIGTALGFGGQADAFLDANAEGNVESVGSFTDKADLLEKVNEIVAVLLEARQYHPDSLLVCNRLLRVLTHAKNGAAVLQESQFCWDLVKQLEARGDMPPASAGTVLAELGSTMIEHGGFELGPVARKAPWERFLRESLRRNPDDDTALFYLAFSHMQLGRLEKSKQLLKHLLQLRPEHSKATEGLRVVEEALQGT
jgi:hypothetical protein